MKKEDMILALGNAMIMLETVSAPGEQNWNALLACKQQMRNVYKALKEEREVKTDENRADD